MRVRSWWHLPPLLEVHGLTHCEELSAFDDWDRPHCQALLVALRPLATKTNRLCGGSVGSANSVSLLHR